MKKTRQAKILELIRNHEVDTQEALAELLKGMGIEATQATISRDIRELHLTKVAVPGGGQRYAVLEREEGQLDDRFTRVLRDGFISMETAQNLLVLKTVSGMAMAVAAALDAMKLSEIVGSIAGDDTIFVAAQTGEGALLLKEKLQGLLNR